MNHDNQLRVIAFFLLGAGALCGIVSYERYRSTIITAQHLRETSLGMFTELEAVTPMIVYVTGFLSIMFVVAAVQCFLLSRKSKRAAKPGQLLDTK